MKTVTVGRFYWAPDYRCFVRVVGVESRCREGWRVTVERESGERTYNYPAYLLAPLSKAPK